MKRLGTVLSLCFLLSGLSLFAQEPPKSAEPPKDAAKKEEVKKAYVVSDKEIRNVKERFAVKIWAGKRDKVRSRVAEELAKAPQGQHWDLIDVSMLLSWIEELERSAGTLVQLSDEELRTADSAKYAELAAAVGNLNTLANVLGDFAENLPALPATAPKNLKEVKKFLLKSDARLKELEQLERDTAGLAKDTAYGKKLLESAATLVTETKALAGTNPLADWSVRASRIDMLLDGAKKLLKEAPKVAGAKASLVKKGRWGCKFMDDRCVVLERMGPPDWPTYWENDTSTPESLRVEITDGTAILADAVAQGCYQPHFPGNMRSGTFRISGVAPMTIEWIWNSRKSGEGRTIAIFRSKTPVDDELQFARSAGARDELLVRLCRMRSEGNGGLELVYIGDLRMDKSALTQQLYGAYEGGGRMQGTFGMENMERVARALGTKPTFSTENALLDENFPAKWIPLQTAESGLKKLFDELPPDIKKAFVEKFSKDPPDAPLPLIAKAKVLQKILKERLPAREPEAAELKKKAESAWEAIAAHYEENARELMRGNKRPETVIRQGAIATPFFLITGTIAPSEVTVKFSLLVVVWPKGRLGGESQEILLTETVRPLKELNGRELDNRILVHRTISDDYQAFYTIAPDWPVFFNIRNRTNLPVPGTAGSLIPPGGYLIEPGTYLIRYTLTDPKSGRVVTWEQEVSIIKNPE